MPELPEVNNFQRYFDANAVGKLIKKVKVSDAKIIRNVTGARFASLLKGRKFTGSYRRGKYLFGALDNGHHVLLHFGMTGDLKAYTSAKETPSHERFHFAFASGDKLGFDCPRKFARILYLRDLEEFIESVSLGEDAQRISAADFLKLAKGKKCSLKAFLLNQKNMAGMGNLYADAVCYDTRIHPGSRVNSLAPAKLKQVHARMKEMLTEAISRLADYGDYPSPWYWDWRIEGNKPKKRYGLVKVEKIAGRTTYYCEGWQKFYG